MSSYSHYQARSSISSLTQIENLKHKVVFFLNSYDVMPNDKSVLLGMT